MVVKVGVRPLTVEVILEEGELHIVEVIFRGVGSKVDITQMITTITLPSAMEPRTHDKLRLRLRTKALQCLVSAPSTIAVLCIEKTSNYQYGRFHIM